MALRAFRIARQPLVHIQKRSCGQSDQILLSKLGECGVITLNRPRALNALTINMIRSIYDTLVRWKDDKDTKIVVIEGSGDKAFCAGGDIRKLTVEGVTDPESAAQFFRHAFRLNYLIGTYPKPYVALMNGITMGGGFGISVHGKFRVCTEKTVFAMPETAIGLFPDVGGGYILPRMRKNLGIYLGLLGHRLKGKDVVSAGIGTHFVHSDKIPQLKTELIFTSNATDVEQVLSKYKVPLDDHKIELEPFSNLIDDHFSQTSVEGIINALEETENKFSSESVKKWCNDQRSLMSRMSPTSMKITLRQLNEGRDKTFADTFTTEYRMAKRCMENHDFHEGVRALIVEKHNKPKWNPLRIEDVTACMVNKYFEPVADDLVLE